MIATRIATLRTVRARDADPCSAGSASAAAVSAAPAGSSAICCARYQPRVDRLRADRRKPRQRLGFGLQRRGAMEHPEARESVVTAAELEAMTSLVRGVRFEASIVTTCGVNRSFTRASTSTACVAVHRLSSIPSRQCATPRPCANSSCARAARDARRRKDRP